MSPSNAVIIPENILQNLKCVKCALYISVAPVAYDDNENLVCGRCLEPNSTFRRTKAFETIRELLLFPCRYSSDGCRKLLNSSQMTLHEDICEFGPLQCPMVTSGKCDWKGNSNLLYEHCSKNHQLLRRRLNRISLNDSVVVKFYEISTYLFVLNFLIDKIKKTINFTVNQIIKDDVQENFDKYQIKFINSKRKDKDRTFVICDSLYDYRKSMLKEKKQFHVDINFFEFDVHDSFIRFEIDIENLTKQNEIASNYLKNLKCPKCSLFMKAFIIVCSNGHSFCNTCFIKSSICPTCTIECTGNRNFILENIAKNSKFPCENKGCNYLGLRNNLEQHTFICLFKKTQCPLKEITKCNWDGVDKNHIRHLLENHTEDYHKIRRVSGEIFTYEIDSKDKESYWVISFDNVYIRCCFQKVNQCYTWSFHQIGLSKNSKPLYKIEIEFIDKAKYNTNMEPNSLVVGILCHRFQNVPSLDSITIPYHCLPICYWGKKLMIRYNVVKINEYS